MSKIVIQEGNSILKLNLKELFQYKDLFITLFYRDVKVRYAQTFLGLLWAFIQPLITLIILTVVFGKAMKINTNNIPYPLFAISGISAWTYFAFVMSQSGNSIIGAQHIIKKIYFPRLIIPLSKAMVGLVDLAVAVLFLMAMMLWYKQPLTLNILYLPIFLIFLMICSLGVGIWLSALTVRYRDFQHILPFVVQVGLYISPVAYPANIIPEKYKLVYYLNPMAGIIDGFRWSLLSTGAIGVYQYVSLGICIIVFFSGWLYFNRAEKLMADIV